MRIAASVLIFAALASLSSGASSRELYLSCSLVGPNDQNFQYSFAFNPTKETLSWVEGSQEFKVFRNTSTQLWASHKMKFRDFAYDQTDFRLNRVTGVAEINYLHKTSGAEVESCKKQRSWGCDDFLVLTEHSEAGRCTVVDRVVK